MRALLVRHLVTFGRHLVTFADALTKAKLEAQVLREALEAAGGIQVQDCFMCPCTMICVSPYCCICVLILLCMCPHTGIYVSSTSTEGGF